MAEPAPARGEPNEIAWPEAVRPEAEVPEPNRVEVPSEPPPEPSESVADPNDRVDTPDTGQITAEQPEQADEPNEIDRQDTKRVATEQPEQADEPNAVDRQDTKPIATEQPERIVEPNEVEAAEPNEPAVVEDAASENAETTDPNETGPVEPNAVTAAEIEPNEPPSDEGPTDSPPAFVERYAEILKDYVREDGRVDYGSLRRRRLELKRLLMTLGELDPNTYAAWSREKKLAFWINVYNLKMLDIIVRNYPIESSWWLRLTWPPSDIRHIEDIWAGYKFIVMDEEFTLQEVERRFFRQSFGDPRVYLALTYACRSSPSLRRAPYTGDDLSRQLDDQVKGFLSTARGFKIDRQKMTVRLSALFKPSWRGKEFVQRYGTDKKFKERDPETRAVLSFIVNDLSQEDVYFLEVENYTLEYVNFDWRLNDTSRGY